MAKTPKIAYHRGRHGKMPDGRIIPENSLAAFEEAMLDGGKIIELDVERDMFISHDAEIPEGAPKLKDVLDLVKGKCLLNVEIKSPTTTQTVATLINEAIKGPFWKPEHFVISTFDHNVLLDCKKYLPNIRMGALMEGVPLPAYIDLLSQKGIQNIHIKWRSIMMDIESGYQLRDAIKRNHIETWVYTVNSKSVFETLSDYGVDVVFTDKPELFR